MTVQKIVEKISDKICADPGFIEELKENANEAIFKLTGEKIEEKIEVEINQDELKIIFPKSMVNDDELENVDGGVGVYPENYSKDSDDEYKKKMLKYGFLYDPYKRPDRPLHTDYGFPYLKGDIGLEEWIIKQNLDTKPGENPNDPT